MAIAYGVSSSRPVVNRNTSISSTNRITNNSRKATSASSTKNTTKSSSSTISKASTSKNTSSSFFGSIASSISKTAATVKKAATSTVNTVKTTTVSVSKTVQSTVKNVSKAVENTVSTAKKNISTAVNSTAKKVANTVNNTKSTVKAATSSVASTVKKAATFTVNAAKSTAITVSQNVKSTVKNVASSVSKTATNIGKSIDKSIDVASKQLKKIDTKKVLDGFQTGLDLAGMIPGVGEIADGANAAIYLSRGDKLNAGLSAAACIPIIGSFGTGGKLVNKGIKVAGAIADGVKIADNVSDTARVVNNASEITKNIAKIADGNVSKFASNVVSNLRKNITSDSISHTYKKVVNESGGVMSKVVDSVDDVKGAVNPIEIELSKSKYPQSAQHIEDAINNGKPDTLTINRTGIKNNRKASLKGIDKVPGADLDEYPPAMFKEGGSGASVRPINPSDNRGAGSTIGHLLRPYQNGTKIKIKIKD